MYYPKSQITTPLYTNGDEFTLDGKDYAGYYWADSNGSSFSGKSPQNPPNNLLLPKPTPTDLEVEPPESFFKSNPEYYNAKRQKFNSSAPQPPTPSVTFPTNGEYETGEFQRYFVRKRNEMKYVEINKTTYKQYTSRSQSVQWQLYAPIQINWILTGEQKKVYEINKNIVLLYQNQSKIFGFYESFKDNFTRFYK